MVLWDKCTSDNLSHELFQIDERNQMILRKNKREDVLYLIKRIESKSTLSFEVIDNDSPQLFIDIFEVLTF